MPLLSAFFLLVEIKQTAQHKVKTIKHLFIRHQNLTRPQSLFPHTQKTTQPDQQLQAITTPKPQTTATNKQANNTNTQAVKPESSTVNKSNDTAKTTKEKVSTEDNNALKFTFYDTLTHKTVKVDANPKVIKKYRYTYMLQVGSYRNKSDANAIRARLILSGLKPTISKIGDWYRLDVGPVYNKRDGDIIKHKVEAAGISGSLLRQVAKEEITDNNTQNNKTNTQS